MSLQITLTGPGIAKMLEYIAKPVNNALKFFQNLGAYFYRTTDLTFRAEGQRDGHQKWDSFSENTLQTKAGTWKIRYGTDMRGSGMQGQYRKGARRYSFNSKLLQASGSFKSSFQIQKVNKAGIVFGSVYHSQNNNADAATIQGKREVLFITDTDKQFIKSYFGQFYREAMK